ncbi:MAG: glycosyltransferase [Patescibacteria group bacterium]|nr:glycosyltransferase [Patescibacteria group bacterium]
MKNKSVSIIILTKNGGKLFKSVLNKIFAQNYKPFEVIIVDSGSTDGTIDLVKNYPVKLVQIKPSEFGHGKTRNFGAKLAKGEIIVFLTQDAVPLSKNWLTNLVKPLENKTIAGVYGRQIPKKNENIIDKIFYYSLYPNKQQIWVDTNCAEGDNVFSSVNSAIRRNIVKKYPFPSDIIVSEDYEWAFKVLKKGYKIFYNPRASVVHSHSYGLIHLFRRNFDIGISYKRIYKNRRSLKLFKNGSKIFLNEVRHLARINRIHLTPYAVFKDAVKFFAINFGKHEEIFPKSVKKKYLSAQRWYWI